MSYQTGSSTGALDLLDKLRVFCAAEGWTVNRNTSTDSGSGQELCLSKGASYFNFKAGQNISMLVNSFNQAGKFGLQLNGSDGYDGGSAWDRQPGYPKRTSGSNDQFTSLVPFVTNLGAFPAYYFFSHNGGDVIHVEIEVNTGIFQRFGFGKLDLYDATTAGDGRYFFGTGAEHVTDSTGSTTVWLGAETGSTFSLEEGPFMSAAFTKSAARTGSAVRCAVGAFDNWAQCAYQNSIAYTGQACVAMHDRIIHMASPNPLNGVGVMTPINVSVVRSDLNYHPLGVVHGIRYLDMTNYQPGDEFVLGSDTWKVFPIYNKGGRSYELGLAHLKVV